MLITWAEIGDLVHKACEDLQTQKLPITTATARKYKASRGRVQRQWNGISQSKIDAGGANQALGKAAEEALCLYINFADKLSIPIQN